MAKTYQPRTTYGSTASKSITRTWKDCNRVNGWTTPFVAGREEQWIWQSISLTFQVINAFLQILVHDTTGLFAFTSMVAQKLLEQHDKPESMKKWFKPGSKELVCWLSFWTSMIDISEYISFALHVYVSPKRKALLMPEIHRRRWRKPTLGYFQWTWEKHIGSWWYLIVALGFALLHCSDSFICSTYAWNVTGDKSLWFSRVGKQGKFAGARGEPQVWNQNKLSLFVIDWSPSCNIDFWETSSSSWVKTVASSYPRAWPSTWSMGRQRNKRTALIVECSSALFVSIYLISSFRVLIPIMYS